MVRCAVSQITITAMSPAEQVARLREQIERANNAYYVPSLRSGQALDAPEISEAEYDRLFRGLQALETAHPRTPEPRQPHALPKHTHRRPMLSLAKRLHRRGAGRS